MPAAHAPIHALIAYDGSSGAGDAVRAAAQLFPGAQATVLFVPDEHDAQQADFARVAVPHGGLVGAMQSHADRELTRARERAEHGTRLAERLGLRATTESWTGSSPWRTIVRAAEELDVDVIVCGTRGHGGFTRGVMGSTSSALLHHAHRPVLVIPPECGDLDGPTAIAYDGSDGARAAVAAAARLLPRRPAIVMYAWSSPLQRSFVGEELAAMPLPEGNEVVHDLADVLTARAIDVAVEGASLANDAGLTARVDAIEVTESASHALVGSARSSGAAVLVTGTRGRGAIRSAVLGSVSAALVHDSRMPVLVAR